MNMLAAISLFMLLAPQTDVPEALSSRSRPNCRQWAEAANYYIDLGEEKAVANLIEVANARPGSKASLRAALICRILFEPKNKRALRQPSFGELSLPAMTMPLSSWPEYPLLQQDGVWFLLDENYQLKGKAESPRAYIDFCRENGRFRTEKLIIPTRQQAEDALKSLQGSKRWRAIEWSDSSLHSSYTYERQWTVDILRSQTHFSD
jgi:hypothetical protein